MFGLMKQRRRRLRAQPFPKDWLATVESNVPFFRRLSASGQAELLGNIQVFLAEKRFEGCGGLELTDEIRVTIAAQACLLLLHRKTDYFPRLLTILVYPSGTPPNPAPVILPMARTLSFTNLPINSTTKIMQPMECQVW